MIQNEARVVSVLQEQNKKFIKEAQEIISLSFFAIMSEE